MPKCSKFENAVIKAIANLTATPSCLESINDNFYYLKQELQIRNELVRLIQAQVGSKFRVLAEYPRGGLQRRDIGIFHVTDNPKKPQCDFFSLEIKFQYPADVFTSSYGRVCTNQVVQSLQNDFNKANCLILILCEALWAKNKSYVVAGKYQRTGSKNMLTVLNSPLRGLLAKEITKTGGKRFSHSDFNCFQPITLTNSPKSPFSGAITGLPFVTSYAFLTLFKDSQCACHNCKPYLPEKATHQNPT